MIFSQCSYYFAFNIKWGVAGNNPMLYHKSVPLRKRKANKMWDLNNMTGRVKIRVMSRNKDAILQLFKKLAIHMFVWWSIWLFILPVYIFSILYRDLGYLVQLDYQGSAFCVWTHFNDINKTESTSSTWKKDAVLDVRLFCTLHKRGNKFFLKFIE